MNRALKRKKKRRHQGRARQKETYSRAMDRKVKEVLEKMGLWEDIRRLGIVNSLLPRRYPRVRVRKVGQTPSHAELDKVVQELRAMIAEPTLVVCPQGYLVSVQTFWTTVRPLLARFLYSTSKHREIADVLERGRATVAGPMKGLMEGFLSTTLTAVRDILFKYGRMNRSLYSVDLVGQPERHGRKRMCFDVHCHQISPATLVVDGQPRAAYRCGLPIIPGPVDWVSWDHGLVPTLTTEKRNLPVFVQSHVFDRIYGRNGRLSELAGYEDCLHEGIWTSLKTPVIHSLRGSDLLVDYRLRGIKLGYLVVRLLPEAALVRTFKFLTMDGTPEGDQLFEKLRLLRPDKEYLGLDKLAAFAASDLQNDTELTSMFRECGCGELFDDFNCPGIPQQGRAQELREYLSIGSD
jgi:hypothetical protein